MADALAKGRYDTVLDWLGAGFPAACAGYAALQVAPLVGQPPLASAGIASASVFAIAFAVMHAVKPAAITFALPVLDGDAGDPGELLLDRRWSEVAGELDELLLDQPLIETRSAELAELLLDDALGAPDPDSRVVQLFAPGQLRERIDRHLANARDQQYLAPAEAADALTEALAELRRSLHRA